MRKLRILVVAPYPGLRDMFISIGQERDDLEIVAYEADLELGARLVSQLDEFEYDVIISRGGTAMLIRQATQLPVIEIMLSPYDLMGAMKLAETHPGKCAIVGFPNICKTAKVVRDILQHDIAIVEIDKITDAHHAIKCLAEDAFTVIVGDTISSSEAEKQGLKAVLITSSRESAIAAVEEAASFYQHIERMREQNEMLNQAIHLSGGEVVVFSEDIPIFSNIKKDKDFVLETTRRMNPFVIRNNRQVIFQKVGNRAVKFSGHLRQIDGKNHCIYLIQTVDRSEHHIIPGVYAISKENLPSGYFGLDVSYDSKLLHDIEHCRSSSLPVVVAGEGGTGKERVAKMLGSWRGKNYCIDFDELDNKGFAYLVENSDSFLLTNGNTVCFRNIQSVAEERLQKLLSYIESSRLHHRNRLIMTLTTNISDLHRKFAYRMFNSRMPCLTIKLPPLRERADDIPELIVAFLREINVVRGLNVLGCEQKGIELLKEFQWEYNLGQLKRVLSTLVSISKGSYISAQDVKRVLENEACKQTCTTAGFVSVNINHSMEEITQGILLAVLREEGMNQTRAAKRLGISRTTFWRMMQRGVN
ncbi:MAG: PrpR N-terminal domain-containing protein [Thermaerobacter sp.]|nr:PrpR N-terminal domain-containing protein [Thermaerobacter sp.]